MGDLWLNATAGRHLPESGGLTNVAQSLLHISEQFGSKNQLFQGQNGRGVSDDGPNMVFFFLTENGGKDDQIEWLTS